MPRVVKIALWIVVGALTTYTVALFVSAFFWSGWGIWASVIPLVLGLVGGYWGFHRGRASG